MLTVRYADIFDDCWRMQHPVARSDGGPVIVIMDGRRAEVGNHVGDASAIAWIVAYVLSGNADNGLRYAITGAELPPYLRGITDLARRAIAPHVVVGLSDEAVGDPVAVPSLLATLQQPSQRDDIARDRLRSLLIHEFLAPGRRHIVSNLVSPSLLIETIRYAYPKLPSGPQDKTVVALKGQLQVLGLLETKPLIDQEAGQELSTVVESARNRIKAACGPMEANPIVMHLVDDNPDFLPVGEAVLGRVCKYDKSLPDQKAILSTAENSILFLDMRLLPSDEDPSITDASGFLYAMDLARKRPEMPIVLFSSTQQRRLQDAVHEAGETDGIHNLITRFSKPSLSARGKLSAKSCMKSLKGLADAAVEAAMMIEQSRAMKGLRDGGEIVKEDSLYASLYCGRWLEVLLLPANELSAKSLATGTYQDLELIRDFAERRATDKQMTEALRVDVTDKRAGWVWALAVIRLWLAAGDPEGKELASFVSRLEAGLLPDYGVMGVLGGIPVVHPGTEKDTIHDVLIWATGDKEVELAVAIKTIIQHVCQK